MPNFVFASFINAEEGKGINAYKKTGIYTLALALSLQVLLPRLFLIKKTKWRNQLSYVFS